MAALGGYKTALSSTFAAGEITELTVELRKFKALIPSAPTSNAQKESMASATYPFGNMFPQTAEQLHTEIDALISLVTEAHA